ncbi:MAG: C-GCAxxG-C-C family protein [Thermodesulfobacteriota bacterium]
MYPAEIVEKVKEKAKANFKTGLNCAESVLEAVLSQVETGLPMETMCLMTGFGGGMGHFGDTCGSLVGAIAALGAVYGRRQIPASPKESREQMHGTPGLYKLFNRLPYEFQQRFGSTQCRVLTGAWQQNWLCKEHLSFCRRLVINMAGLAAEMAVPQDLERWGSEPFGIRYP